MLVGAEFVGSLETVNMDQRHQENQRRLHNASTHHCKLIEQSLDGACDFTVSNAGLPVESESGVKVDYKFDKKASCAVLDSVESSVINWFRGMAETSLADQIMRLDHTKPRIIVQYTSPENHKYFGERLEKLESKYDIRILMDPCYLKKLSQISKYQNRINVDSKLKL